MLTSLVSTFDCHSGFYQLGINQYLGFLSFENKAILSSITIIASASYLCFGLGKNDF